MSDFIKLITTPWALKTAELLRQGRFEQLNIDELAEKLEDLGKKECKAVANRLVILLAHLLKWHYQPTQRSSSWRGSMIEQRKQILRQLKFSPSVKPHIPEAMMDAYPDALDKVVRCAPIFSSVGVCWHRNPTFWHTLSGYGASKSINIANDFKVRLT